MHFRGVSVREIPFMLFLGLLFAVTVGWWVFLTLTVSVVFGNVAAAVFAVCSALSVTVGYGLVRASDSRELYWSSFLVTLCSEIMLYIETPLVSYSYSLNEVSHSCTS